MVVARIEQKSGTLVMVAPVTHTPPETNREAIEIPANVKRRLGLDPDPSWVVVTELNRFIWPGPDVRPVPGSNAPFYDALPDWLFERVRSAILEHSTRHRLKIVKRTE